MPRNILEELKKVYNAQSIEKKDFSLRDLFSINPLTKAYQQKDGSVILPVSGLASKYVSKYENAESGQRGFHTTVYLADGKKTGAFSNALLSFAEFFYEMAQLPVDDYRTVRFPDGTINVRISKIDLPEAKTTYNFEIVGGEINRVESIGGTACYAGLLGSPEITALPESATAE